MKRSIWPGSCKGDSGGPLMVKNIDTLKWVQIATVQGSFGQCGEPDVPGLLLYKWVFHLLLSD